MTSYNELNFPDWHSLLWGCMPDAQVHDRDWMLLLARNELSVCVGEPAGRWRARHRRGMHRLGFRRFSWRGLSVWHWTLALDELDAAARAHALTDGAEPLTRAGKRLTRWFSREQLMREQLRRVLSDVFGFEPEHLCVHLQEDEDDWGAEDDRDVAGVG